MRRSIALAVATAAAAAACASAHARGPAPARALYVSAFGAGQVDAYLLGPDGAPSGPVPGSPFRLSASMSEAAILSPDGQRLYVTDRAQPGGIDGFAVQPDGSLRPLPGSPYPTDGDYPVGLAFSSDGTRLFATNYNAGIPFTGPIVGPGSIKSFVVGADGRLTSTPGASVFATGGLEPIGIVTSPDGRHLYVTHNASADIAVYDIAAGGTLKHRRSVPSGASGAVGIAISPDGRFLYVDNAKNEVVSFTVDDTGTPRPHGTPVSTRGSASIFLALARDGRTLWTSNLASGTVAGISVKDDGTLGAVPQGAVATGGTLPQAIAFSPDANTLYIANRGSGTTSAFRIGLDDTLTPLAASPYSTGLSSPGYSGIAVTPGFSPVAAISVRNRGRRMVLSAATSRDVDGEIVRYDWDLGDGHRASTTDPRVTHRYRPGRYTASVTLTDNDGCSASEGFTGRTTACAGAEKATATRRFVVRKRGR